MNRKFICGALAALLLFCFAGCGGEDRYPNGRRFGEPIKPDMRTPRLGDPVDPNKPRQSDDPESWLILSQDALKAGNVKQSLEYIDVAIAKKRIPRYLYFKGRIFLSLNEFEKANALFQECTTIEPDNSEFLVAQGTAYLNMQRYEEALALFRQVLQDKFYPTPYVPYFNIGLIYFEQGQFDDALVVFRKALQERADLHMAHEKVGVILSRKNVLEEAEYHLQRATDLLRTSQEVLNMYGAEYYYNLGECQLKLGKNDKAYQSFAKARDLDPESEFGLKARDVLKKFQARHG